MSSGIAMALPSKNQKWNKYFKYPGIKIGLIMTDTAKIDENSVYSGINHLTTNNDR